MRKGICLAFIVSICSFYSAAQSCSDGPSDGNQSFFTFCQTGSSLNYTGAYAITVGNGITLTINGNVTINGTLTISMVGSTSILHILSPYTLHVTNMTFSGSATAKNIVVDGPSGKIVVDNTLDFGGLSIDLDGAGSISAGSITGAGNISCNGDGNCPSTTAGSCSPSGSTFCTTGGFVLPVELLYFKNDVSDESVTLSWATASELNFDYFSLERSSDGKVFEEIAQVKGNGTTNKAHTYSYKDDNPLIGLSYYRLTSIDFDGYRETFTAVSASYRGPKRFTISPNPSDGSSIKLNINFADETNGQVIVYNNMGSIMGTYPVTSNGSINFPQTLTAGVYMARYTSTSFTSTERF
ncbi:MAG TPA: T9SS type A sorting domain-containing protein, partial [Cyclobacteriaceae bacterium]|nr:T9SS type A sorting domain-containing protein [Cyclobacteriaceae bacterium]